MNPQSEKLLSELQDRNADTRYAAWVRAAGADPEVTPELGKLLTAAEPGVRKAADEALKKLVHSVGREPGRRRAEVVKQLLALTGASRPKWVRTVALRHLSAIGGDETVAATEKMLRDPEMQEEAVFCIERIPGAAADNALIAAAGDVKDDFKPRVLAALGHRRTAAAAPLCAAAMTSPNIEIALAAMKALGRIGREPGEGPKPPAYDSLGDFQKVEFTDSVLRYADGMVESGRVDVAIGLYKAALARPDEHLQCAAIIGLGKTKDARAAALIEPKRQSTQRNVRITAERVWAAMPKA
jgi:HEAT repeat protein